MSVGAGRCAVSKLVQTHHKKEGQVVPALPLWFRLRDLGSHHPGPSIVAAIVVIVVIVAMIITVGLDTRIVRSAGEISRVARYRHAI
jgi:hypothetical protein